LHHSPFDLFCRKRWRPILASGKAILSHLKMSSTKLAAKDKHSKPKTTKLEDSLPAANSPQMNLFDF
jgi:hypothetical protein